MYSNRKLLLFCFSFILCTHLNAQIEAAHLFSKGLSATGYGVFLRVGVPVHSGDEISGELGFYYLTSYGSNIALIPILAGYRHFFDGSGSRLYMEPTLGYSFGGTDIRKTDANGSPIYDNGNPVDQKISGLTTGMSFGYLIPSVKVPLNIGVRYQHLFVSGDPSQNIISLRLSYSVSFGRRGNQ